MPQHSQTKPLAIEDYSHFALAVSCWFSCRLLTTHSLLATRCVHIADRCPYSQPYRQVCCPNNDSIGLVVSVLRSSRSSAWEAALHRRAQVIWQIHRAEANRMTVRSNQIDVFSTARYESLMLGFARIRKRRTKSIRKDNDVAASYLRGREQASTGRNAQGKTKLAPPGRDSDYLHHEAGKRDVC